MSHYILIDNETVRKFKPHATVAYLKHKYPERAFEKVGKPPTATTLDRWMADGISKTPICKCTTEIDGRCPHGRPSWALALRLV